MTRLLCLLVVRAGAIAESQGAPIMPGNLSYQTNPTVPMNREPATESRRRSGLVISRTGTPPRRRTGPKTADHRELPAARLSSRPRWDRFALPR